MKEKTSDKSFANEKPMKRILDILTERSEKPLELARKELLAMNIESQKGRRALEYYAINLNDVTHPGILSLASEAVGGKPDETMLMQVVVLLLTAAMDIHDDIIDQTKMKNGKPTVFGKFGKDTALLIGDAILMRGLILFCKYGENLPLKTMRLVSETIQNTFFEVGNAHLLETELKRKMDIIPTEYMRIIEKKASNIEALTRIGAIIGKGSRKEIEALGKYGKILGILITLREEFVDVFEPEELRNRMKNGCLPIPILYAFQDPQIKEKILNAISKRRISRKTTEEIVDMIFESKDVEELREIMKRLSNEASRTLLQAPKIRVRNLLDLLIRSTLEDL